MPLTSKVSSWPTTIRVPLGPPTWDELTRLALDEPIEGERSSEAMASLLVMQWRHLDLSHQYLPQQQSCMGGVAAEERPDVPQARRSASLSRGRSEDCLPVS